MPKRALPGKRPEITLDPNASIPLYKQLYERLRLQILAGQLEADTRLPSTRVLASELGASRNTAALAYEMLQLEGYIESRVGDGTHVARLQPEQLFQHARHGGDRRTTDSSETPPAVLTQRGQLLIKAPSSKARLAIVTPSHQFPTGVTMSLSQRLALLEWAREAQAWIIEDDYDSEYRFSGRPLEALQGLDHAKRVIYIGTFSKVLFPSLRLGYLVAPTEVLKSLIAMRRVIDIHLPLLEQMALADFIAEGHFVRHLRKMRGLYRERRNALREALTQELGDMFDVTVPEAGMHLVAWLPEGMSAQGVAQQASAYGLHTLPLSLFSLRSLQRDGLLFGFASASPEELRAGVKTLALALREKRPELRA